MYNICFNFVETHPTERYWNQLYIEQHALHWREIGLELNLTSAILDNIEANNENHKNKVQDCCKAMLKRWLKEEPKATWKKLLEVTNAGCYQYTKYGKSL